MKNKFSMTLLAVGLLIPLSLNAFAQGSKPQNGRPPHEEGKRRDGDRDFRSGPRRNPAKMQLGRTWRGISALEKSKTPLSKTQAKQVVALVLPWSKKQKMSSTEAENLDDRLKAILTTAQKSSLEDHPFRGPRREGGPRGEGPRGESPRGEGPRGGGGPRSGERERRMGHDDGPRQGGREREGRGRFGDQDENTRQLMRSWMESYNPFYAPTGYASWKKLPGEFQQNIAKRYKENRATLESLSRKSK